MKYLQLVSIIFVFLLFFQPPALGSNFPDSIAKEVEKLIQQENTAALNLLAEKYLDISPSLSFELSFIALKTARKNKQKDKEASSLEIMAKTCFYQDDYKGAVFYFKKSAVLFHEMKSWKSMAKILYNIGFCYRLLGNYTESLNFLRNSLNIHRSLHDSIRSASTLNQIGVVYFRWRNYEKALEHYQEALNINENLHDKEGISTSLNNIGEVYLYWRNYDKALDYYNRALRIDKEMDDHEFISTSINNIGEVYKSKGDYMKALEYYNKAIEIQKKNGHKSGLSYTYNNIGEVYEFLNQYSEAKSFYRRSIELKKEIADISGMGRTYFNMGNISKKEKLYLTALGYYNMSVQIAKGNNLLDLVMDNYKSISDVYQSIGDFEKALSFYIEYTQLNDVLFEHVRIAEIQTKIETEKLNREKELQNIQLQNEEKESLRLKYYIIIAVIGFFIIFGFSILLLRLYNQKKRSGDLLALQKKEITDSIEYASRIQSAILPPQEYFVNMFPDSFILYIPRDIVSGDFYWAMEKQGKYIIAVADCTGHGVPGAFMSMLGTAFLNEITSTFSANSAAQILDRLCEKVISSLRQTGKEGETKDGMDIALCIIDPVKMELQFSAAMNSMYFFRNEKLTELRGDRMPIGIHGPERKNFTNYNINLQKNDIFYIFTDGYADQIGEMNGKKMKYSILKSMITDIHPIPLQQQKEILLNKLNEWKGYCQQTDDILLIGFKI